MGKMIRVGRAPPHKVNIISIKSGGGVKAPPILTPLIAYIVLLKECNSVCRAGEWMLSADKKGSVLAYEQEHNIIPVTSTHILTTPNTQEIHQTISG